MHYNFKRDCTPFEGWPNAMDISESYKLPENHKLASQILMNMMESTEDNKS